MEFIVSIGYGKIAIVALILIFISAGIYCNRSEEHRKGYGE